MPRRRRKKSTEKQEFTKAYGRVQIMDTTYQDSKNFAISSVVVGQEPYKTYVEIKEGEVEDITCTCEDYYNHYSVCKHTLASVMAFAEDMKTPQNEEKKQQSLNNNYRSFKQIVNTFYNEEIEEIDHDEDINLKNKGTIKLEPKIIYDKFSGDMKVEFKIGNKRMYKIKSLAEFYTRMIEKETYKYGEKLQFVHTRRSI